MHLRSNLFSLVALGLIASNAFAATATYTLDLSVDNSWKVFGQVSAGDNFGIALYSFRFAGNTITVDNASPRTTAPSSGTGDPAGFTLVRSADNTNAAAEVNVIVSASQDTTLLPNSHLIYGFGQEASSFVLKGITAGGQIEQPVWGVPMLLAQGTYDRSLFPGLTIDMAASTTFMNVFNEADIPTDEVNPSVSTIPNANESLIVIPFGPVGDPNDPPTVVNAEFNDYNANLPNNPTDPKVLQHQFTATDPDLPAQTFTWDFLSLLSYTPGYGYDGSEPNGEPLIAPTLSTGGLFNWVSEGSRRGDYVWQVRATDSGQPALSDLGTITVHVTGVPEPSTLALFGLAMVGAMGFIRRRNG